MLSAGGEKRIGRGRLRWTVGFTHQRWYVGVEREGLALDTRFIPPTGEPERDRTCLYLLLRGSFEIHAPHARRFDAPSVFVLSETQIDGAAGMRPFTYRAAGEPYLALELHLPSADVLTPATPLPTALAIDERVCEHATAIVHDGNDAHVAPLLAHLAALGIVSRSAADDVAKPPPRAFVVLWGALRPMIERLYLTPTLQEIGDASGISVRQIERYTQEFVTSFALVGDGWRPTTRHLRLKLAILLASAEDTSVAEIARAVGYGGPDAMARAFRDAGLPPPSVMQERVRVAARDP